MTQPAVLETSTRPAAAADRLAEGFLTIIAQSILDKMDDSLFSDFAVEATPELAENIWSRWSVAAKPAQRRAALEAIARCSFEDMDALIERVEAMPRNQPGVACTSLLRNSR